MDARLSAEQLAALRRAPTPLSPKDVAKDLGVTKAEADALIAELDDLTPVWAGREPVGAVLGIGAVLLFVITLFSYSNNTQGMFLFDDKQAITTAEIEVLNDWMRQNARESDPLPHKLATFREGAARNLDALFAFNKFRVVTYATFAFENWWFAEAEDRNGGIALNSISPEPHVHVVNNVIHACNGLLATWLAYLTFTAAAFRRSKRALRYPAAAALLTGAVFSLHPLQSQAVSYLAQRAESLGAFFLLLSLCLLLTARRRAEHAAEDQRPHHTLYLWCGVLACSGLLVLAALKIDALRFSQAVLGIVGLVVAGIAASVWLVRSGRDERWHAAAVGGGVVAFMLGLEAKEIVGVLPGVLLLHELLFGAEPASERPERSLLPRGPGVLERVWLWRSARGLGQKERLAYHAPWAAGVLAVLLAFPVLGGSNFMNQLQAKNVLLGGREHVELTSGNYLLTQANVFHTYVRLAALPYGQTVDHDYPLALEPRVGAGPTSLGDVDLGDFARPLAPPPVSSPLTTLLSLAALLGCVALALGFGGRARVASFALGFALLVLAPSSSFIVLADVIFEHRFYLPLLGGALVLPVLVGRLAERAKFRVDHATFALILVLGGVGIVLTRARNERWKHELALWSEVTERSPNKPRGWVNLGLFWQKLDTHTITYALPSGEVHQEMGVPKLLPGGEAIAIFHYSRQDPEPRVVPVQGTGVVPFPQTEKAPEQARETIRRALAIEPYGKALNNLATISLYDLQHLLQEQGLIQSKLVKRYREVGDAKRLAACERRLAEIPAQIDALAAEIERALLAKASLGQDFYIVNNLGSFYSLTNHYAQAEWWIKTGLEQLPREVRDANYVPLAALGEVYQKWGVTHWLRAHQATYDAYPAMRKHLLEAATQRWQQAREQFREYLRLAPNGILAKSVRESLSLVEAWLRGEGRPPLDTPIPHNAGY